MKLSSLLFVDQWLTIPNRVVDLVYAKFRKAIPIKEVSNDHVLILKLMGMGSLIKLTSVLKLNHINLDRLTICTFKQNQEICKILGYSKAIFIEDSWPKLLPQVVMFPFRNQFDLVIDAERNVNSSSLFRKYIALVLNARSVYFDFKSDNENKSDIGFDIKTRNHSALFGTLIPLLSKRESELPNTISLDVTEKKNQILFNINASEYLLARRYPIKSYVEVIESVHKYTPTTKIILTGSNNEKDYVQNLAMELTVMGIPYENACGKWGLHRLKSELEKSLVFVSNDSGPMHLAVMLKVPTVVVWGPTHSDYSGYPESGILKNVSLQMECSPCFINSDSDMGASCQKRISCMKDLDSNLVFEKIRELLSERTRDLKYN